LSKLHKDGLIRSIGVAGYGIEHLKDLKKKFEIVPALNQVYWNIRRHDDALVKYCKDNNILLQTYSSLKTLNSTLLNDPTVASIAAELSKSPAQILLRWNYQNGIAIVQKATSKNHLVENMDLNFVIPENHMATLNNFTQSEYP
jgi:methylglyoxal/glyoxal reductase